MFMNVAYLNNSTSTVVDNTKPLIVTSCGNYRVNDRFAGDLPAGAAKLHCHQCSPNRPG